MLNLFLFPFFSSRKLKGSKDYYTFLISLLPQNENTLASMIGRFYVVVDSCVWIIDGENKRRRKEVSQKDWSAFRWKNQAVWREKVNEI